MKALLLIVMFASAALAASGVNFSGKWVIEGAGRGGQITPQNILVLNHVGDEVSGTFASAARSSSGAPASREVLDGKVEGNTISFYVWAGRSDRPAKTFYKGIMTGEQIVFTVTGGATSIGGAAPEPREMTAKRAK
jgi:hypothetical protein